MQYYHNRDHIKLEATAVACGKFDGIHKGHQALLQKLKEHQIQGLKSAVFTFDATIAKVMPDQLGFIYTGEERKYILENMGIDYLAEYAFEPALSSLQPEDFIRQILVQQMGAKVIVVGEDFHFGYHRLGDINSLLQYQEKYGYQLEVVEKQVDTVGKISSSRIRQCISEGNMEKAQAMLGRPYFVRGEVIHGKQLGRTIGMPTANIAVPSEKLVPPRGVYVSKNYIGEEVFYGITNIGMKPTVNGDAMGVETFLFDFDRDIYGKTMLVEFLTYERPEQRFDSVEQLSARMHLDAQYGMDYAAKHK